MRAVAQRYAGALADVAIKQGTAEKVKAELASFLALVEESPELRNFLSSPAVARPAKQGVIEKLVSRLGASPTLRNLLFVIVENRCSPLLPQIQQRFEAELHARLGVAEAYVTSARELSGEDKTDLMRALERLTGKRIEARYGIDPELIGGAVARVGSTIYDGSVRAQLNQLRTKLAAE